VSSAFNPTPLNQGKDDDEHGDEDFYHGDAIQYNEDVFLEGMYYFRVLIEICFHNTIPHHIKWGFVVLNQQTFHGFMYELSTCTYLSILASRSFYLKNISSSEGMKRKSFR
jgi:hypothetical protein